MTSKRWWHVIDALSRVALVTFLTLAISGSGVMCRVVNGPGVPGTGNIGGVGDVTQSTNFTDVVEGINLTGVTGITSTGVTDTNLADDREIIFHGINMGINATDVRGINVTRVTGISLTHVTGTNFTLSGVMNNVTDVTIDGLASDISQLTIKASFVTPNDYVNKSVYNRDSLKRDATSALNRGSLSRDTTSAQNRDYVARDTTSEYRIHVTPIDHVTSKSVTASTQQATAVTSKGNSVTRDDVTTFSDITTPSNRFTFGQDVTFSVKPASVIKMTSSRSVHDTISDTVTPEYDVTSSHIAPSIRNRVINSEIEIRITKDIINVTSIDVMTSNDASSHVTVGDVMRSRNLVTFTNTVAMPNKSVAHGDAGTPLQDILQQKTREYSQRFSTESSQQSFTDISSNLFLDNSKQISTSNSLSMDNSQLATAELPFTTVQSITSLLPPSLATVQPITSPQPIRTLLVPHSVPGPTNPDGTASGLLRPSYRHQTPASN